MSAIEWTDETWNPTTGCDQVSPGCGLPRWDGDEPHGTCYALTMAARLKGMGQEKYQRDGDPRTSGPGFGITEHHDVAYEPLRWRKPRRVFVNSMSDLFHIGVSDEHIALVWVVMATTPQHTYQVLTKRHGRMRSLLSSSRFRAMVTEEVHRSLDLHPDATDWIDRRPWPLHNVWLGVSVEDQKRADLRVPALLDTPAAVRFLSCEPLLGPVDLGRYAYSDEGRLHWVIVGGESGPGARPMHPDWPRSLRDQCSKGDDAPAFFFKQWGNWAPIEGAGHPIFDYVTNDDRCQIVTASGGLRGRPWPGWKVQDGTRDGAAVRSYGKKQAGRELDGRTWDEFPVVAS